MKISVLHIERIRRRILYGKINSQCERNGRDAGYWKA